MGKYNKSSKQKMYSMKGCSKNTRKNKKHLGGSADVILAYPSTNVPTVSNSNLAYSPSNVDISRAYPTLGPTASGFNFLNSNSQQGGGCGCGMPSMTGGKSHAAGCMCSNCMGKKMDSVTKHRSGCMCSMCRSKKMGGKSHASGCMCSDCMGKMIPGGKHVSGCMCDMCRSKKMGGASHAPGCTCSDCMEKMRAGANHGSGCMCSKCKRNKSRKNRHNIGCACSKCIGKKRGGNSFSNSYSCISGSSCTDMTGGSAHRIGCKCSVCKRNMSGGGCNNPMSNNGIPYPDGLLGNAWKPSVSGWPGVDGVSMNRNHLGYNTYAPNDVSREMLDVGAAPPFTYLGGKKSKSRKNKKGGTLSNFLGQDLINLGRQFQFGVGSSYNAIRGYASPVNPMPWRDQMTHKPVQLPS